MTQSHRLMDFIKWNQVNMRMRNFQALHDDAGTERIESCVNGVSNSTGKSHSALHKFFREFKKIVNFLLRDYQRMAFRNGTNIQEGNMLICLGHFMAGNIAVNNFCEDSGHNNIQIISYWLSESGNSSTYCQIQS